MILLPDDNHSIVNYHYVEDPQEDFSGIHPCSVATFEQQIKWLSKNFRIVTVEKVYEAARRKSPVENGDSHHFPFFAPRFDVWRS